MSTIITVTTLGRASTEAEGIALQAEIEKCVAANTTSGTAAKGLTVDEPFIRIWATNDAANAWISWLNANFDPAPVSASVQTI